MPVYNKADPEILEAVRDVVRQNHRRLDGVKMAVLTRDKAGQRNGRPVLAYVFLPPASMEALLAQKVQFVMVIAEDQWERLDAKKREALIDHELCHCAIDVDGKPYLRPHDLEEFADVIERHGFWRKDDFGERAVQQALLTALPLPSGPMQVATLPDAPAPSQPSPEAVGGPVAEADVKAALAVLRETKRASVSGLQRRMRISYTRVAAVMDELEKRGIVSPPPADGQDREILMDLSPAEVTP